MRRDEDATELRSDILRKNALIADLTAMNQRRQNNGHADEPYFPEADQKTHSETDGAVELELAQTKVHFKLDFCPPIRSSFEIYRL